jgi:site-specific DNA-methyltransferase (adenine-specific)
MTWQVINGSSAEILKTYPDNSFDCVVTDPPYGISFLGKAWDHNTGDREVYEQCLRVLKPGGHLLAFSAARTYHHLAMTVETVGFEIRDQIMWIYGSGFPKSQDVGRQIQKSLGVKETISNPNHRTKDGDSLYESGHQKTEIKGDVVCTDTLAQQWSGWGTQLKPAHEPIVMARKPIKNTVMDNVQEYGTGAINIDACRVSTTPDDVFGGGAKASSGVFVQGYENDGFATGSELGRFPANVLGDIDEPYQKYFYCPKVSQKERNIGHQSKIVVGNTNKNRLSKSQLNDEQDIPNSDPPIRQFDAQQQNIDANNHPTVKPIELMKYLIKLVTPPNGHILDPFNGSGSTGCAAVELGFDYTGIELDPNYVEIATKRISHWEQECKPKTTYNNLFEEY